VIRAMNEPSTSTVSIAPGVRIGGSSPLLLIAGPCVIESRDVCLRTAEHLKAVAARLGMGFVFKASFDKANRSSISSYRGPGLEQGLEVLRAVKETVGVPVTSDIHLPAQAAPAAEVLDLIQIPAFLCRQTDLLAAAAATGKPVNVKKGQFLAPEEITNVVEKCRSAGRGGVCVTERGTFFGYHRLVNDFTGIPAIRRTGVPLVFDATHSVQFPGARGNASGGAAENAAFLLRAAAAVGVDGLFTETHPCPRDALCDAFTMIPLEEIEEILAPAVRIDEIVRHRGRPG